MDVSPAGMCSADNCARPVYARGRCSRHHKQWQRHGHTLAEREPASPCSIPGCTRPSESRGWCHGHYLRWIRTGDVQAAVPLQRRVRGICSIRDCGRRAEAQGLCRTHYERWRADGDPAADRPIRIVTGDGALSHGYWEVRVPDELRHLVPGQKRVHEHRLVMAQTLGRPLCPDENVHHLNGDRLDNRPENLQLWSCKQPSGQRVEDKVAYALTMLKRYAPHLLRKEASHSE